ncbi:hypothetical protein TKK_0014777 [Trichogramma kaykai]|uniref:Uncharacterized protein n=1 Tax=Trichogramma kaykai TaxID=54128 RepID=A0ABD2WCB1_9HYME
MIPPRSKKSKQLPRVILPYLETLPFHIKCVAVESERAITGDQILTPYRISKRQNLRATFVQAPNFLELNRRIPERRKSDAVLLLDRKVSENKEITDRGKSVRSKSLDSPIVQTNNLLNKRSKIYPPPLPKWLTKKQEVSSLVNSLLMDIYGSSLSGTDHFSRSESESYAIYRRGPHLQRSRLELKSTLELRVVLDTMREQIRYIGSMLVRELRRRDYTLAKREKLCEIVTFHLRGLIHNEPSKFVQRHDFH